MWAAEGEEEVRRVSGQSGSKLMEVRGAGGEVHGEEVVADGNPELDETQQLHEITVKISALSSSNSQL